MRQAAAAGKPVPGVPPGGQRMQVLICFGDSFYFPATCDASFLGCFSSHLGPVRHSRFHRRLGDSGREQTVKKHRSVTKPVALRRRAQRALRLPPELRACVCLTERSRMRGVQGGLVTVCALTPPPP